MTRTMHAMWLKGEHVELRSDVPIPTPSNGEALVRVLRAGICNTDIELVRGYYPYDGILGHEFVGVVEEGAPAKRGKRVVGEINAVCGTCTACKQARRSHCENRTVLGIKDRHGAFAEYLTLPDENLHLVPDTISTDAATFTEPLAAALEIQEQVEITPRDRVIVLGAGKLGQLIAQTLALTNCDLSVVARSRWNRERLERLGIRAIQTTDIEPKSFDVAVECTGNAQGFAIAQRAVRPRGTLVMKSTYAGSLTFDASALVVNELTVVGSRCGPFPQSLHLLREGNLEVESLIVARYPLTEGLAAIETATRPQAGKVLLEVERV